ncbi:MAG: M28 family peptidase [Candidatus Hodarchaeota archaeon]
MDIEAVIASVDVEQLYTHILNLEGVRHPLKTPDALKQAEDYILKEFQQYGLSTNVQEFKLEGLNQTFSNIEGCIGDGSKPELLVISHHDTIETAPGADDNASAIAVMLESARILQEASWSGNARFISFTLEEGHPGRQLQLKTLERQYGIRDDRGRYTSWHLSKLLGKHRKKRQELFLSGTPLPVAFAQATALIEKELTKTDLAFLRETEKIYKDLTVNNWPGKSALIGSSYWVDEALRTKKPVKGVLCNDTIGYTTKDEHSQRVPKGISPSLFNIHGTNDALSVGDFLIIIGDQNSAELAESFCTNARRETINLPYACLQGAFSYEQAAQIMGDILRSDHAPFWRAGIPALFFTDSGEFRTKHYHRPSDTIDTLDFEFLTKICQATIATTIELVS